MDKYGVFLQCAFLYVFSEKIEILIFRDNPVLDTSIHRQAAFDIDLDRLFPENIAQDCLELGWETLAKIGKEVIVAIVLVACDQFPFDVEAYSM